MLVHASSHPRNARYRTARNFQQNKLMVMLVKILLYHDRSPGIYRDTSPSGAGIGIIYPAPDWSTELSPSLVQPDPYAGGEGLVTCYTRSCSAVAYRPAPIRLQLFCIAMVTRGRNNRASSFNIACLLG